MENQNSFSFPGFVFSYCFTFTLHKVTSDMIMETTNDLRIIHHVIHGLAIATKGWIDTKRFNFVSCDSSSPS
jgi:hypothetical protein